MSYMGMGGLTEMDYSELDDLFDRFFREHGELYIFGMGNYGIAFSRYLHQCGVSITGFVVSSPERKKNDGTCRVLDIAELKALYQNQPSSKIGVLLALDSKYYGEVYPKLMFLGSDLYAVKKSWLEMAADRCGDIEKISLIIPVCDYCEGIACYGCTVASPIAGGGMYSFEQYKKDMNAVRAHIGSLVGHVNFTGGDVFLHPDFIRFIEYARQLYPDAYLDFSTNGLKFNEQAETFWQRLAHCGVGINWTLYPVTYPDYSALPDLIQRLSPVWNGRQGILLSVVGDDAFGEDKHSWHIPYTFQKQQARDWLFCRFHKDNNQNLTIWNGTLSTCFSARRIKYLAAKFPEASERIGDAARPENLSLCIDAIQGPEEILDYMRSRHPICDFCAIRRRRSMGKWLPSKGELSEWVITQP